MSADAEEPTTGTLEPSADERRHREDDISALDELFRATLTYRKSEPYLELMRFISRFPRYAPFNGFLLYTQNPKITFVATATQWRRRFGRTIKTDARPLLILAPMGPVAFVYDLANTEGSKLPQILERPFGTEGSVAGSVWYHTRRNCEIRDRIAILEKELSPLQAGMAMTNPNRSVTIGPAKTAAKRVVHLNGDHSREQQYATLVHELAHIHCGHLGGDCDGWWPDRRYMSKQQIEFEAESVSYMVCSRLA